MDSSTVWTRSLWVTPRRALGRSPTLTRPATSTRPRRVIFSASASKSGLSPQAFTKLEWSKNGNNWTDAPRVDYNYFVAESGFGAGSTYVRIAAADGQQLVDQLPEVQEMIEVQRQVQFE